ncbi:MAG: glycosyltransferase family 9 protein, partial [Gemmataceae bacterium]
MNVAVFLPNWIGDAVMATPALRALRNHFPDGEIVGVCKPYVAGVLEGGDWFDHLLLANDGTWKRGILATARQLRQRKCDLAILFPNTLRSAMTAWMGGCRRIVGYARYGRSALLTDAVPPRRTADGKSYEVSPVLDAYNRLVEIAGYSAPGHDLQLFTTPADEASADEIWNGAPWNSGEEVVCLNTGGAFGASKNWPRASFVELAQRLVRERGCGVLIVCGPAEKAESQAIAEQSGLSRVASLGTLA